MVSCGKEVKLVKTAVLSNYASGSAMVCIDGMLYLASDNMGYVVVLDQELNVIDSITVIDSLQGIAPKATKADLEAATTVQQDGRELLLLLSSGSLDPYRNTAWLVDTRSRQKTGFDLRPFYSRLKAQGVHDLNIEGAATTKDRIILSARGNKTNQLNHLIFTSTDFWKDAGNAPINIKTVSTDKNADTVFSGVSGLEYSAVSDRLILTVSTENTANSYDDGEIGKSYLWLVSDFSHKSTNGEIVPDRIIDLEAVDSRFHGQKIETACVVSETNTEMKLALAADNDDGKTKLFLVIIKK